MSISISATEWLAAAKHRRTVYPLKGTSKVSDDRVGDIIKDVLSFAPSSYNIQPVRITLVVGDKHKRLWDIVKQEAEPMLKAAGDETWNRMSQRFEMFKAAYGSILFWERGQSIKDAQSSHQATAHILKQWGDHASGMAQLLVWTAVELEGVGANLQHMNIIPPVEAALRKFCDVPDDYELKANMNYGDEAAQHPAVPQKLPVSETFKHL